MVLCPNSQQVRTSNHVKTLEPKHPLSNTPIDPSTLSFMNEAANVGYASKPFEGDKVSGVIEMSQNNGRAVLMDDSTLDPSSFSKDPSYDRIMSAAFASIAQQEQHILHLSPGQRVNCSGPLTRHWPLPPKRAGKRTGKLPESKKRKLRDIKILGVCSFCRVSRIEVCWIIPPEAFLALIKIAVRR